MILRLIRILLALSLLVSSNPPAYASGRPIVFSRQSSRIVGQTLCSQALLLPGLTFLGHSFNRLKSAWFLRETPISSVREQTLIGQQVAEMNSKPMALVQPPLSSPPLIAENSHQFLGTSSTHFEPGSWRIKLPRGLSHTSITNPENRQLILDPGLNGDTLKIYPFSSWSTFNSSLPPTHRMTNLARVLLIELDELGRFTIPEQLRTQFGFQRDKPLDVIGVGDHFVLKPTGRDFHDYLSESVPEWLTELSTTEDPYIAGTTEVHLDKTSRIKVPQRFTRQLEGDKLILLPYRDIRNGPIIYCFTQALWTQLINHTQRLTEDQDTLSAMRERIFKTAYRSHLDHSGRMTLPAFLCRHLGLSENASVHLVGQGSHFRIEPVLAATSGGLVLKTTLSALAAVILGQALRRLLFSDLASTDVPPASLDAVYGYSLLPIFLIRRLSKQPYANRSNPARVARIEEIGYRRVLFPTLTVFISSILMNLSDPGPTLVMKFATSLAIAGVLQGVLWSARHTTVTPQGRLHLFIAGVLLQLITLISPQDAQALHEANNEAYWLSHPQRTPDILIADYDRMHRLDNRYGDLITRWFRGHYYMSIDDPVDPRPLPDIQFAEARALEIRRGMESGYHPLHVLSEYFKASGYFPSFAWLYSLHDIVDRKARKVLRKIPASQLLGLNVESVEPEMLRALSPDCSLWLAFLQSVETLLGAAMPNVLNIIPSPFDVLDLAHSVDIPNAQHAPTAKEVYASVKTLVLTLAAMHGLAWLYWTLRLIDSHQRYLVGDPGFPESPGSLSRLMLIDVIKQKLSQHLENELFTSPISKSTENAGDLSMLGQVITFQLTLNPTWSEHKEAPRFVRDMVYLSIAEYLSPAMRVTAVTYRIHPKPYQLWIEIQQESSSREQIDLDQASLTTPDGRTWHFQHSMPGPSSRFTVCIFEESLPTSRFEPGVPQLHDLLSKWILDLLPPSRSSTPKKVTTSA